MREIDTKFNPVYGTEEEFKHAAKERSKSRIFLQRSQQDFKDRVEAQATIVNIDGVIYESISKAAITHDLLRISFFDNSIFQHKLQRLSLHYLNVQC